MAGCEAKTEVELLAQMKTVAVRRANRAVDRQQLGKLRQARTSPCGSLRG